MRDHHSDCKGDFPVNEHYPNNARTTETASIAVGLVWSINSWQLRQQWRPLSKPDAVAYDNQSQMRSRQPSSGEVDLPGGTRKARRLLTTNVKGNNANRKKSDALVIETDDTKYLEFLKAMSRDSKRYRRHDPRAQVGVMSHRCYQQVY